MQKESEKIKSKVDKYNKFINPFKEWKDFKVFSPATIPFVIKNYLKKNNQADINSLQIVQADFTQKQGELKVIWLGHSTILIQDGTTNLLFDPIFAETVSKLLDNKRIVGYPSKIQRLPEIHAIFLSHDHYDHCDTVSIAYLQKQYKPCYFIGKNSSDILQKDAKVIEMDWWDRKEFNKDGRKYQIQFVPACHWSGRTPFDSYKRLWGGFIITTPDNYVIYFAGDTGKCDVFKTIGEQNKKIDLAFLPIGAYQPHQFLKAQHINPEEAVKIHKQINAKKSIGIHWGTYKLSNQDLLQPIQDLKKALIKYQVNQTQFITIKHGQSFHLKKSNQNEKSINPSKQDNQHLNSLQVRLENKSFLFEDSTTKVLINPNPPYQKINNQLLNIIILSENVQKQQQFIYSPNQNTIVLHHSKIKAPKENSIKMMDHTKIKVPHKQHQLEIYYIKPGWLIKNSSGKYIWFSTTQQNFNFRNSNKQIQRQHPQKTKQCHLNAIYSEIPEEFDLSNLKLFLSIISIKEQNKKHLNQLFKKNEQLKSQNLVLLNDKQFIILKKKPLESQQNELITIEQFQRLKKFNLSYTN